MPLTDTAIKALKPGARLFKVSDGEGLQLHVTPQGSKLWRLACRFGGKQKLMALGAYPELDAKEARAKAHAARVSVWQQLRGVVWSGWSGRGHRSCARVEAGRGDRTGLSLQGVFGWRVLELGAL